MQRVDAIDPALRRSGRFDAEIEVTTPREQERFQILKVRFIFYCLSQSGELLVNSMTFLTIFLSLLVSQLINYYIGFVNKVRGI